MSTEKLTVVSTEDGVKTLSNDAIVVNAEAASEIRVTAIKRTRNPQMVQLRLEQDFQPPKTPGSYLAMRMKGVDAFSNPVRTRVSYETFGRVFVQETNIFGARPGEWDMVDSLPLGEEYQLESSRPFSFGANIPAKLVFVETLNPRTWKGENGERQTQRPKTAGKGGETLMLGSKPIYINTILAAPGMSDKHLCRAWDEDYRIIHDNHIEGSTLRQRTEAANAFNPEIPAEQEA